MNAHRPDRPELRFNPNAYTSTDSHGEVEPQYPQSAGGRGDSIARLRELALLQPDWDSYGSPSLHPIAVEGAQYLLVVGDAAGAPAPYIGPATGGGVFLQWNGDDRELEMYVWPDGSVEWVTEEGSAGAAELEEGTAHHSGDSVLPRLFQWLARG